MAGAYGGIILNHIFGLWSSYRRNEEFEGPPEWITALVFT